MFTLGPPRLGLRFGQVALSTQGASAVVSFSGAGTAPLALTLAQAPTSPPALAPQQRSGLGSVLGVLRVAAGLCVWSGGLLRASLQRAGLGCWAGLLAESACGCREELAQAACCPGRTSARTPRHRAARLPQLLHAGLGKEAQTSQAAGASESSGRESCALMACPVKAWPPR